MTIIRISRGDTSGRIGFLVSDASGAQVLSGATAVWVHLRRRRTSATLSAPGQVDDAATGAVSCAVSAVSGTVGSYLVEVEVIYGATRATYPIRETVVEVEPDIADG